MGFSSVKSVDFIQCNLKSDSIFASGPTGTDACIDLESRLVTAVWMNDTR